jgi:signal peptidase
MLVAVASGRITPWSRSRPGNAEFLQAAQANEADPEALEAPEAPEAQDLEPEAEDLTADSAVPAVSAEPTGFSPYARIATAALSRMFLTVTMSLTIWAAVPALLGWHPTTVVTGSMEPSIRPGDVVSARPVASSELKLGMVLLVDDPDHANQLRLHRLVGFNPDGRLVLRGDANPHEDSSPVERQDVRGVGSVRVPYVATPILWLHEGAWIKLAMLIALILLVVAASGLDRHLAPATEEEAPQEEALAEEAAKEAGAEQGPSP